MLKPLIRNAIKCLRFIDFSHDYSRRKRTHARNRNREVVSTVREKLKLLSDAEGKGNVQLSSGFNALVTMMTDRKHIKCQGPAVNKDITIETYKDMHAELSNKITEIKNLLVEHRMAVIS